MITAYTDGGSRGNPGPAGYGVHIENDAGETIADLKASLGQTTNNVAEYHGLIAALDYALAHGHRRLRVRSDSQLLIRQMLGEYRVKHPGLQPLYEHAKDLTSRFERVVFEHVRRELNKQADRLANDAMNEAAALAKDASAAAATPSAG